MASILVVSGPSQGDYYLLGRQAMVIGRDDTCPIQIVDDLVSRRHAQINTQPGRGTYRMLDLGSANGTFLNDQPIAEGVLLDDGDIIRIGETELMFSAIDFADGETAFQHYRKKGEGSKSTIITREGAERRRD